MKKTKKKHFDLFEYRLRRWIDYLGLKGWHTICEHGETNIDNAGASYSYELRARIVKFIFSDVVERGTDINKLAIQSAFHEVCELLLARLVTYTYEKDAKPEEIEDAVHEIIRILENTVLPLEDKIFEEL